MSLCPNCGLQRGLHHSILPGCLCTTASPYTYAVQQPQRTWVELTDEDIWDVFGGRIGTSNSDINPIRLLADARKLEDKLKQKNGFPEENT